MNKEIFDKRIKEIYETGCHTGKKRAKIEPEFFENLVVYYPTYIPKNLAELYFWVINKLSDYPKCLLCGKNITKFRSVRDGYNSKFCSIKCSVSGPERNKKSRQTCLKRYGVEYVNQIKEVRNKFIQTCLKKYGTENPQQNKEIKNKTTKTMFERYGDDYSKTRQKYKKYVLPSGKEVSVQGYEHNVIDELLKFFNEEEINIHQVPKIFYEYEGQIRFHLPDIFIPKTNTLIEVKSPYTLNIKLEQNLLKQKAAQEQGYSYEIWVCDGKKIIQKM